MTLMDGSEWKSVYKVTLGFDFLYKYKVNLSRIFNIIYGKTGLVEVVQWGSPSKEVPGIALLWHEYFALNMDC